MEKYMGYQAKEAEQRQQRLLPEIDIAGTLFHVDIVKLEFREVGNPLNRMPIIGAKEEMGFSHFFFDTHAKNLFAGKEDMKIGIPDHVRIILLPPLKELDPIGLARQQGLTDNFHSRRMESRQALTSFSKETKQGDDKRKSRSPRL
nr:hypothetical protein [Mucilaginibacter sp. L294]